MTLILNIFTPSSSVSIADFKQVNVSWVAHVDCDKLIKLRVAILNFTTRKVIVSRQKFNTEL